VVHREREQALSQVPQSKARNPQRLGECKGEVDAPGDAKAAQRGPDDHCNRNGQRLSQLAADPLDGYSVSPSGHQVTERGLDSARSA